MKAFLFSVLLSISFHAFAQKAANDNIVKNAKQLVDNDMGEAALEELSKAKPDDYRIDYFTILAKYILLKKSDKSDFISVNSVRAPLEDYIKKSSTKDKNYTARLKEIAEDLRNINPSRNAVEDEAFKKERENRVKIASGNKRIEELKKLLADRDYKALDLAVKTSRNDNSIIIEPYNFYYLETIVGYETLKQTVDYSFSNLNKVRTDLSFYSKNYLNKNKEYDVAISNAEKDIAANFPKTEIEYNSKLAERKRKEEQQRLGKILEEIRQEFIYSRYQNVLNKISTFPPNSAFKEDLDYYKTYSTYLMFDQNHNKSFAELHKVRNSISEFLNNTTFVNDEYRTTLFEKSKLLEASFPKTEKAFNEKLLKDRQEMERAVKEQERIALEQKRLKEQQDYELEQKRIRDNQKLDNSKKMNKGFFAIGYEGGTIAKYGVRIEMGGKSLLGFFVNARTTLAKDADLISGNIVDNKNEGVIGFNIKIAKWMFLNLGGGYGYYKSYVRNDYRGTKGLEINQYYVGYGGTTLRLGNRVNFIAGTSLIDITKDLYTPEITFGLTVNLK